MSPARMEKVEAASRLALDLAVAFNRRNWAAAAELLCEDLVLETSRPAPAGLVIRGRDAALEHLRKSAETLPECRITVEEVMSFGQRCVARFKAEGLSETFPEGWLKGAMILQTRNGLLSHLAVYTKC